MAITFLFLTILVQIGVAMTARSAADAAVAASAHRLAIDGSSVSEERERLTETLTRIVPGVRSVQVDTRVSGRRAIAIARLRWEPPGPLIRSFWIRVRAEVPRVVAP